MKDTSPKFGCLFVTSRGKDDKTGDIIEYFCNKIQAEDSEYCPKHVLMAAEEEEKKRSFPERMRAAREFRKEKLAALAASPLAAVNPGFDKKGTGYEV